jgi:hypothetical protein
MMNKNYDGGGDIVMHGGCECDDHRLLLCV